MEAILLVDSISARKVVNESEEATWKDTTSTQTQTIQPYVVKDSPLMDIVREFIVSAGTFEISKGRRYRWSSKIWSTGLLPGLRVPPQKRVGTPDLVQVPDNVLSHADQNRQFLKSHTEVQFKFKPSSSTHDISPQTLLHVPLRRRECIYKEIRPR